MLVVVGVGNSMAGDDNIGLALAEALDKLEEIHSLIRVEIVGSRLLDLVPLICSEPDSEKILVVDSAHIEQGCVLLRITPDSEHLHDVRASHGISLIQVLQICASLCPREIYLLLVKGERFDVGTSCISSESAQRGAYCLTEALRTVLGEHLDYDLLRHRINSLLLPYLCSESS